MKKILLILIALPFLLFSCSETIDNIVSAGQFDSKISGDIVKDFNGVASFVHGISTSAVSGIDGSTLVIGLSKTSSQDEIISLTITEGGNTSGIATGTYNSNTTSGPLFIPSYVDGQNIWIVDSTFTNSITLSKVGETQVKGEFVINLTDAKGLQAINITGTFDALGTTTKN